jgi:hypothetical protein
MQTARSRQLMPFVIGAMMCSNVAVASFHLMLLPTTPGSAILDPPGTRPVKLTEGPAESHPSQRFGATDPFASASDRESDTASRGAEESASGDDAETRAAYSRGVREGHER